MISKIFFEEIENEFICTQLRQGIKKVHVVSAKDILIEHY